jgi:cytochrome c peroxidase
MDVQGARPLSLLNVAYVTNTSWTGKFGAYGLNEGTESLWGKDDESTEVNHLGLDGLEAQNIEGLKIHRMAIDDYVLDELGYRAYFDAAFASWPEEERYGLEAASFAISAYLRTLLTTEAPFQKWLQGNYEALSRVEKEGALLFFGKAGCYRCHQGPALNANVFYALGVKDLYETGEAFHTDENDLRNFGRGGFTGKTEDLFAFKVPGIYNMSDAPFYFHGSSKRSLREVVEYFNAGIPENDRVPQENIAPHLHPLGLSDQEIEELVTFLEVSLRDPALDRYVPDNVLSGNCFPNNDPLAREDLGCK